MSKFAAEVGISRQSFYTYKTLGMPTDSVEAAKAWVDLRKAAEGQGGRPAAKARPDGELRAERLRQDIRGLTAEADLKEYRAAEAKGELVRMADARQAISDVLLPLRVLLDSLPKACAVAANPSHPELAEDAIRAALTGIYKQMDRAKEGEPVAVA